MRKIQLAILAILSCFFISCETDDFGYDKTFSIGPDSWPISNKSISVEYLRQTLEGYGWRWIEGRTIKNGKVTKENYYQVMIGSSPSNYYFHDGIVTAFFAPDAYPVNCYWDQSIRYDDESNDLWLRETHQLRIVHMDSNHFTAVDNVAVKSDGTKVFVLNTWQKMTDSELNHHKNTYTHDFQELLDMRNN